MEVSSILGAMVYGPGGAILGKFNEIALPEIKVKVQENKPTDGIGTRRLPALNLDPMEVTFKADGMRPDFHSMASNPFQEFGLQVRSNLMVSRGQGRALQKPVRLDLRGWFSSAKEGVLKQGEGANCEYKMEAMAVKLVVDGKEIRDIDIDNYIWRVDGVDLLEEFRKNLGIA